MRRRRFLGYGCVVSFIGMGWGGLLGCVASISAFTLLFYLIERGRGNFLSGFKGGVCWAAAVLVPLFWTLGRLEGMERMGQLGLVGLCFFLTFYAAFLIAIVVFLLAWVRRKIVFLPCCIISSFSVSFVFLWFFLTEALFLSGPREGFFLFNPLLPWMDFQIGRAMVSFLGQWGALALVMSFAWVGAFLLIQINRANYRALWGMGLLFSVGIGGVLILRGDSIFMGKSIERPCWINRIVRVDRHALEYCPSAPMNRTERMQTLCTLISNARKQFLILGRGGGQMQSLVLLPESAFPFLLEEEKDLQALVSVSYGCDIILGCYRSYKNGTANACCWFSDGVLEQTYIKQHGVAFVERLPWWCDCSYIKNFFSSVGCEFFVQGNCEEKPCFFEMGEVCFVPLLCSELFFMQGQELSLKNVRIPENGSFCALALVNDAWFLGSSVPALLWRVAALRSVASSTSLLYVSYLYEGFFDGKGGWLKL